MPIDARLRGAAWSLAVAVGLALPYLGVDTFYITLLSEVWIFAIAAVGLDLVVGYTGLVSFAHGAIFGSAAYTVGIMAVKYGLTSFPLALVCGILVATLISILFGLISLRASGPGFIIITLALNQLVWGVTQQWTSLTGGDNGLAGFARPAIGPLHIAGPIPFYYFSLAFLAATIALLGALVRSPLGLALIGVREEPDRMEALGYSPWFLRFVVFVVGGSFAGLSGVLFAYYNQFVSPVHVDLSFSIEFLIMVFLGGKGTLSGPVLGAFVLVVIGNLLSGFTDRWQILLGALYVIIVLYAKGGIAGIAGDAIRRLLRRQQTIAVKSQ